MFDICQNFCHDKPTSACIKIFNIAICNEKFIYKIFNGYPVAKFGQTLFFKINISCLCLLSWHHNFDTNVCIKHKKCFFLKNISDANICHNVCVKFFTEIYHGNSVSKIRFSF